MQNYEHVVLGVMHIAFLKDSAKEILLFSVTCLNFMAPKWTFARFYAPTQIKFIPFLHS